MYVYATKIVDGFVTAAHTDHIPIETVCIFLNVLGLN